MRGRAAHFTSPGGLLRIDAGRSAAYCIQLLRKRADYCQDDIAEPSKQDLGTVYFVVAEATALATFAYQEYRSRKERSERLAQIEERMGRLEFGFRLHRAAFEGNAPIVKILLEAGADPLLRDYAGQTAREVAEGRIDSIIAEVGRGDVALGLAKHMVEPYEEIVTTLEEAEQKTKLRKNRHRANITAKETGGIMA